MAGHSFSHEPREVPQVDTRYRRIKTAIPVPESLPLLEKMYRLESRSMHGQMPLIWDRAEGVNVYDQWGNMWLDFTSTIFVTNAGHGNERIRASLAAVVEKPLLHTYTYANHERIDYLEYLIENTPSQFEKAFFLSAGTESTEVALKLMRLNGLATGPRKRHILCFEGNWHGRTLGAQLMSGNDAQKAWIGYDDEFIHHLPFPYEWRDNAVKNPGEYFLGSLNAMLEEKGLDADLDLCGVMLETFQGWGAVFYPKEFVQAVVEFSHNHGMLVAFDEMQAGFGRTGEMFGYMHYDVEPDILCCGKGASSSMPLAIVLGQAKVMDLPEIGSMSSTHSANPLACAAGLANLHALLDDGLIENARVLGELFHQELNRIKQRFSDHIGYVNGLGLIAGVIFLDKQKNALVDLCDKVAELAMQRGLLVVHTGRESIKLAPPLSINKEALLEGLGVFEQAIEDVLSEGSVP
jgi:4-aminobutyrate aminotransferase / (S)-3-amino-2-methylpropionate transaminase / 5-aminovalerate transaminase